MGQIKQSIIISYKETDEERKHNLQSLLPFLFKLIDNETEIILVEQNIISNFESSILNKQINHIFIYNNKIFNKGRGYNIGVNNARGSYLIFNDIDMFLKIESYRSSLEYLKKYDVVNPYNKLYYLNKIETNTFIDSNYNFDIINTLNDIITPSVISGGIFMMKKEKFLDICGFDENCYGYGYEDDIFDIKIKNMELDVKYINDIAIHIYHKINKLFYNKYYNRQEENKKLFHEYQNFSTEQLKKKLKNTQ